MEEKEEEKNKNEGNMILKSIFIQGFQQRATKSNTKIINKKYQKTSEEEEVVRMQKARIGEEKQTCETFVYLR